ncbi:AI-2E family transporter, partial [Porphyromonas endodontalis]
MENRPHEGFKGLSPSANRSVFMWAILLPILLLTLIFGREALPYLSGFLGAITLFSILRGQMRFLTKKWHFPRWLAAFLLILETLFLFLLPLAGIASMLIDLFTHNHIDLNEWYHQAVQWVDEAKEWIGVDFVKRDGFFVEQVLPALTKMGQTFTTKIVVGVYSLVVNSVVLLFVLYYMLYEREYFETAIRELLPFTEENKRILVSETQRIIAANAVGIPLIAIVQGGFAYLGYIFFGVEGALFYAVLTAFATIIPMVGTMVVYVPLALAFGFAGNWGSCIGLLIYGFLVIGGIDNVIRFLLQKSLADIHPLVTVFGVIFGVSIFGFWGV